MFFTFEKIKELADKQGISLNKLEEKLGFSRNTIYNMKKSTPNVERVSMIADYFNVSTDYLLGRTDNPTIAKDTVTTPDGRVVDLSNLRERVVLFDGKPLSDDDVDKIAQIIKLSLGVSDIESKWTTRWIPCHTLSLPRNHVGAKRLLFPRWAHYLRKWGFIPRRERTGHPARIRAHKSQSSTLQTTALQIRKRSRPLHDSTSHLWRTRTIRSIRFQLAPVCRKTQNLNNLGWRYDPRRVL